MINRYRHYRRCNKFCYILINFLPFVTLLLAQDNLSNDTTSYFPSDALLFTAVETLIMEEETEHLCVLIYDGNNIKNISEAVHSALIEKYPNFFTDCDDKLFIIGPLKKTNDQELILNIGHYQQDSPCRYKVTKKGEAWQLKKEPCIVL